MRHTRKPLSDTALQAMQQRNAQRVAITKRVLGSHYILHPVNQVQRVDGRHRTYNIGRNTLALFRSMIA
jgi:hypothetical protein